VPLITFERTVKHARILNPLKRFQEDTVTFEYRTDSLTGKSRDYHESNKSNYWSNLIAREREGARHLFESKGVEWLVPFAPLRSLNEPQAVVEGKSNLLELNDREWLGLAEGLSRILRFFHGREYVSFNAVLVLGPMDEHLNYFDVNLR